MRRFLLSFCVTFGFVWLFNLSVPIQAQGQTDLVLALYYPWYTATAFGEGITPFQPIQPSSSTDIETIQRQVNEAVSADMDGFVVSWNGPSDAQAETVMQTMLQVAVSREFKTAVYFETGSPFYQNTNDRIAALLALLKNYAEHPAYLQLDDKPVIFFAESGLLSPSEWTAVRDAVDPDRNSVWIAEGAKTDYLNSFDGLYLYNVAGLANAMETAVTWAANTRNAAATYGGHKYWVATAMPGWDNRLTSDSDSFAQDRNNGTFYQSSFAAAAFSAPDLLLINSYNGWHKGSQIEPDTRYGNLFLALTAQLSATYKAGALVSTQFVTPEETAVTSPTAPPLVSPTARPDGTILYTIAPGDTVLLIAIRFGILLTDLSAYNNVTADTPLIAGETLILGYGVLPDGSTVLPGLPYARLKPDGTIVHLVREGDSLITIAATYQLTLEALYELSGLNETSLLSLEQEVVVGARPQPVQVGGSTDLPGTLATATLPPPPTIPPTTTVTATLPPIILPSATAESTPVIIVATAVTPPPPTTPPP